VGEIADAEASAAGTATATAQAAAQASAAADGQAAASATAIGASIASSVANAQGVASAEAEGAGDQSFADAAMAAAGAATATAVGASIAEADAAAQGVAEALAISDAPQEEVEEVVEQPQAGGAGAYIHPDLLTRKKKKRQPQVITLNASDPENDFRILWEAVKIRNDSARMQAAMAKRAAVLADLEKAAMVRVPR